MARTAGAEAREVGKIYRLVDVRYERGSLIVRLWLRRLVASGIGSAVIGLCGSITVTLALPGRVRRRRSLSWLRPRSGGNSAASILFDEHGFCGAGRGQLRVQSGSTLFPSHFHDYLGRSTRDGTVDAIVYFVRRKTVPLVA